MDRKNPNQASDKPIVSAYTGRTEYRMVSLRQTMEVTAAVNSAPFLALSMNVLY